MDDGDYVKDFDDDAIPNDPSRRKVVGHEFGKGGERFDFEEQKLNEEFDLGGDALDLDPQLPERKIKGYVQMDKGEERFKDKVPDNPLHDDM